MSWLCSLLTLCTISSFGSNPSPLELYPTLPSLGEVQAFLDQQNPTAAQKKERDQFLKKAQAHLDDFTRRAQGSERWAREEWFEPRAQVKLDVLRQLNWLQLRKSAENKGTSAWFEKVDPWFQFAADLAYNEASQRGLLFARDLRRDLIKEIEQELKWRRPKEVEEFASVLQWSLAWRTPWPVDRMLLFEGKQKLSKASMNLMEKAIPKIQKNPYLNLENALKKVPGQKPKDLRTLHSLWNETTIASMQEEMNLIQDFRLRLALKVYELKMNRMATSQQDLIKAKILSVGLVDYGTSHGLRPLPDRKWE